MLRLIYCGLDRSELVLTCVQLSIVEKEIQMLLLLLEEEEEERNLWISIP